MFSEPQGDKEQPDPGSVRPTENKRPDPWFLAWQPLPLPGGPQVGLLLLRDMVPDLY